ncbi:MAG: CsgG/HfaB family protein [Spirochaetaceae bacterium]|nr:CsgG/HfaB family protein [Spirochaetaceae bacterium]
MKILEKNTKLYRIDVEMPVRGKRSFMNKNVSVLWGMTLAFSLIACKTVDRMDTSIENPSVFVKRIDNRGDESVRIYIDGKRVGRLDNGEIQSYNISAGVHSIYANYDGDDDKNSEIIHFTINNNVYHFSVEVMFNERNKYEDIKIVQEDAVIQANNFDIDGIIAKSFAIISRNIPEKMIVAVVNIKSEDSKTSEYVIDELTLLFVNSGKYDVVDRVSLDIIRNEQNFQMTGEVDDNSIISIGHILGAGVVITGSIDEEGNRLRLKALDVKTARILAMSSEGI